MASGNGRDQSPREVALGELAQRRTRGNKDAWQDAICRLIDRVGCSDKLSALATDLKVQRVTVDRWVDGKSTPHYDSLRKLVFLALERGASPRLFDTEGLDALLDKRLPSHWSARAVHVVMADHNGGLARVALEVTLNQSAIVAASIATTSNSADATSAEILDQAAQPAATGIPEGEGLLRILVKCGGDDHLNGICDALREVPGVRTAEPAEYAPTECFLCHEDLPNSESS